MPQRALLTLAVVTAVGVTGPPPVSAAPPADASPGRIVYEKANCVGCHKWHGGGGGGYGGAALSLRETGLDRDELVEIVRCGRPGTGMPYFDRRAYRDADCYDGLKIADLPPSDVPRTPVLFLRPEQIEAVVTYVQTAIQGRGEVTKAECVAYWGADARECAAMP